MPFLSPGFSWRFSDCLGFLGILWVSRMSSALLSDSSFSSCQPLCYLCFGFASGGRIYEDLEAPTMKRVLLRSEAEPAIILKTAVETTNGHSAAKRSHRSAELHSADRPHWRSAGKVPTSCRVQLGDTAECNSALRVRRHTKPILKAPRRGGHREKRLFLTLCLSVVSVAAEPFWFGFKSQQQFSLWLRSAGL
jgi:hypothetical protein